ncbi:hypothetical protein [Tautonia rosea]|uniref:hypothetical protein n=1 Tax=Tautonia rosea TaxID=2728037 RepID=UPI0014751B4C|nr:hypothetical protein [Tautonia rosea]
MSQIELLDGETIVAELVPQPAYQKNLNQVACVTDRRLVFLRKKKFGVALPYTIEYVPISECQQISYSKSLAIFKALAGGLMVVFGLFMIVLALMALLSGDSSKPAGNILWLAMISLPLAGTGAVMVADLKRHNLRFQCGDRKLHWVSSGGHGMQHWLPSLNGIRALAQSKGIPTTDFPESAVSP